jgi:hypothetical protein
MHWLDPEVLPRVHGRVARYTLNARGDVDGVLLDDDRQIHVPPHLGAALEKLVGPGETIEARYVKPRNAAVFAAVSVSAANGKTIVDDGPPHRHGPKHDHPPKPARATKAMHVRGRVRVTLYAPKGEVCGAELESGVQLRVDPKANADLAECFAKGAEIDAWGEGLKRRDITVLDVHEIAFSSDLAESFTA